MGSAGRIFYIIGPSSSGKDTIYRRLMAEGTYRTLIPCTTRPIRSGEREGREYHFTDEAELERLRRAGLVVEERCYQTVYGPWYYFTVDDGTVDGEQEDILLVGTLESYQSVRAYYGSERVVPLYITVEDGERLQRALTRERRQAEPKYEEMCRRYLSDKVDFAEERIKAAGITRRFFNHDLDRCVLELQTYMKSL